MARSKLPLAQGEALLLEGPASLQRGLESVGGRLYVTTMRVEFLAHAINVQTEPLRVVLPQIAGVSLGKTRLFGVPLAPNAVEVHTHSGELHRFTVYGRSKWQAAIDSALAQISR